MVENDNISNNLIDDRKSGVVKVQIVPATPKTLSHLPNRPPVDLAFHNLTYRVKEGRSSSKYNIIIQITNTCMKFHLIFHINSFN
jgi:hypothetical protein